MKAKPKNRLDRQMVENGLSASREKSQALIMSGCVFVNGVRAEKPGTLVSAEGNIEVKADAKQWVSRGALKLLGALDRFEVNPEKKICFDVGASTGGFTEVLLHRGAHHVLAIDVGTNQMDWKIRKDPRVTVFEKTNARTMELKTLGKKPDLIVMDLSFISVRLVIPNFQGVADAVTDWIILVKPQFEAGPENVPRGGVIKNETKRKEIVDAVKSDLENLGMIIMGQCESPIKGTKGNVEYFLHLRSR